MHTRLVNPVHFFNHHGDSALSYQRLIVILAARDAEIENLKRIIAAQARRHAQDQDEKTSPLN